MRKATLVCVRDEDLADMDKEAIAECLKAFRDDIARVKVMMGSDLRREERLDNIEAALCVLMEALLDEPTSASQ